MTRITAHRLRLGTAVPFGLLVLAAGPALAVECGDTITGFARLERDLICTTDPALTVDGGVLDLGGFTIVCDHPPPPPVPPATGVGILLEGEGALLRNGAVTGCFLAVHVLGEGGHTVLDLTASAIDRGVFIESDGNRVLDSHVLRALDDAAVQVDGAGNLLRGNVVAGAGDRGIDVRGLVEPTGAHFMAENLIVDGVDGIALLENSNGNLISRNTIYRNGDQGIFVGTLGNTIERNQALLNRVDLQDNTADCDDNLWRDNTFETSVSDDCVD
jgi:parallel beta-helix repeat protein